VIAQDQRAVLAHFKLGKKLRQFGNADSGINHAGEVSLVVFESVGEGGDPLPGDPADHRLAEAAAGFVASAGAQKIVTVAQIGQDFLVDSLTVADIAGGVGDA